MVPFGMLHLFGLVAVTFTLVCYAFEDRSPGYILGFAAGSAASAVYGFMQGAWPFGLVEIAWTIVAFRRWTARRAVQP